MSFKLREAFRSCPLRAWGLRRVSVLAGVLGPGLLAACGGVQTVGDEHSPISRLQGLGASSAGISSPDQDRSSLVRLVKLELSKQPVADSNRFLAVIPTIEGGACP